MNEHPTAIVSWAHTCPGWNQDQAERWRAEVMALVDVLRDNGVDADIDLHHSGDVDWTRFGPQAIVDKDWVLVALSPSWKERWEGLNDPTTGAGAAGEANALRSIWIDDQMAFRSKLVLVTLPMMRGQKLTPLELHGVEHLKIAEFTSAAVTPLLRLLTNQPAYPRRPLGPVPRLEAESRKLERFVEMPVSPRTRDALTESGPDGGEETREPSVKARAQSQPAQRQPSSAASGIARRRMESILKSFAHWVRALDANQKLATAAILATVIFGVPAWLAFFHSPSSSSSNAAGVITHASVSGSASAPSSSVVLRGITSRTGSASTGSSEASHVYSTPPGIVWIKISRLPGARGSRYVVQLSWGRWHRSQLVQLGHSPVYLTTYKSGTDKTPLNVTTQPAAGIGFGRSARSGASIAINNGWTRS